MAGGVMTCQITGTPICGKDAMAIIVRQGVSDWARWMPMTIPSHGGGNDDFMALDPLEPSLANDMFAETHGYENMGAMLDDAFVINNRLPKTFEAYGDTAERLSNCPFGIVYINKNLWPEIKEQVEKNKDDKWIVEENDPAVWAKNMIEMFAKKKKDVEGAEWESTYRKENSDVNWETWYFNKKWDTSNDGWNRDLITWFLNHWSEHCDKYSIEAYYPVAKKLAEDGNLDELTKFFEGVVDLLYISMALSLSRNNWIPKPSPQEYEVMPMQDFLAQMLRKEVRREKAERKEQGY